VMEHQLKDIDRLRKQVDGGEKESAPEDTDEETEGEQDE
jgi:hypothetical protein